MIATTPELDRYLTSYAQRKERLAGREPSWLASLRADAISRFAELGFPTTRDEEWKYTNVALMVRTVFSSELDDRHNISQELNRFVETAGECRLVFVNGRYASTLSAVGSLPHNVKVGNLAREIEAGDAIFEAHLASYAKYNHQAFAALNTAHFEDGAYVQIPRGVIVEEPIHLLYIATGGETPFLMYPRTLIVAEENSQATIVETYVGEGLYFTNAVTEMVLEENAVLDHYKVQQESEESFHIAVQQVQQARSSNFSSHNLSFGGALTRNDINTVLAGEAIESTINGLFLARGDQHVDNHTAIDHAMPHCNSHELYKGMIDDHATGVFNGKILVRQDAQKTDAKQTNQNLLLSEDATVDTKPQLEIYADDVRCTHGATVGQLDREALFYLRTRGIDIADARALLTYAFASDVLGRIRIDSLRNRMEQVLLERLRGVGSVISLTDR